MNPARAVAELRDADDTKRLGTAFAISRTRALTAYHCVRGRDKVLLRFIDQAIPGRVVHDGAGEDNANDLALLELAEPLGDELPNLTLSAAATADARVVAIGFPYEVAAPRFTVGGRIRNPHAEHPVRQHATRPDRYIQWLCEEAISRLQLRGLSGGPLIMDAGTAPRAVGVVIFNETADDGAAKGAAVWAAAAETVARVWPKETGHLVRGQTYEIVVAPATRDAPATRVLDVPHDSIGGRTVVRDIYAPLSVRWASTVLLNAGTRGGEILDIGPEDGDVRTIRGHSGYASFLSTDDTGRLAAVRYTRLELRGDPATPTIATIDSAAGGYCVEWRPDGQVLAVGGTNVLKVFGPDLELLTETAVGGRHGVPALDFVADTLWFGLGNGELRMAAPPYKESSVVTRRADTAAIAVRRSREGELAVMWKDGLVQVWAAGAASATFRLSGNDTWTSNGPKLAWGASGTLYLCNGLDRDLYVARLDRDDLVWRIRMDRRVTSLDVTPDGQRLAIGLDEKGREDASILVTSVGDVEAALSLVKTDMPDTPAFRAGHLLAADWKPLLIAARASGVGQQGDNVALRIPSLEAPLNRFEDQLDDADAEQDIIDALRDRLERLRGRAQGIEPDVRWLASAMFEAGFLDHQVAKALDRFTSFAVNGILGDLPLRGYPPMGSLTEFVASVLGEDQVGLLYLGFDAFDGGGITAIVPLSFLQTCEKLVETGQTLGVTYDADSDAAGITIALQLMHEFDYLFSYEEQRRLWFEFVLPQSAARYPREQLVINSGDIRSVGLA
jgi:WD40 repeat protein